MQKNVGYIGFDQRNELNQFIANWEMLPESGEFADMSVTYAQTLMTAKMDIPTVGASGSVFGVLLAFGMLFPNTMIYVYFMIPIKAKYFVILYGLFELFSGVSNNPGDNVAHFAHLGGMVFGFFLIRFWNKNNRQQFY
jgi:membrane associated rhomboid family serine protease